MNRILFGGAFDPVHNGHLNMAEKATKTLSGEVIFIPARISVWKETSSPASDKINMLKLAIKGRDHFSIDEFEINSEKGTNYSIDTVLHFKSKYPNDKLFYLIGADQVNEFHRWKEAEKLSELAQLVFYTRPGFVLNQDNIKKYKMVEIDGGGIEVSSTAIRELKSFELPIDVLLYIVEHNLYKGMEILNKTLSPHRLAHSKEVAKVAYQIAESNNMDEPVRAFIAGLFHDLGKDIDKKLEQKIMEEHFPDLLDFPKFAFHQFTGSILVQEMFEIHDEEIIEAIKYHSTGSGNMSKLAKIIYAADKIEPTRGYDSSNYINAMKKDIDEGFKIVLQANKDFLLEQGKTIDNALTCKCFKKYL